MNHDSIIAPLGQDLVVDLLDLVCDMADSTGVPGLPTGFLNIDRITSGFDAGDLIVVASRPSIGKSTLAINIAEHVFSNEGLPVIIFSMESSSMEIMTRIIASMGRIRKRHLETGGLTDDEWPRLTESIERIRDSSAPFQIFSLPSGAGISDFRDKYLEFKEEVKAVPLLVIDCLQMMGGDLRDNLIGLKALAKELSCAIILTSQIGDSVEFRTDKRPTMFDVRDIPGMEYIPDVIMFLYRDEYYTKEACKEPCVAEVNVIRNRTGKTGIVKLTFIDVISRLEYFE